MRSVRSWVRRFNIADRAARSARAEFRATPHISLAQPGVAYAASIAELGQ